MGKDQQEVLEWKESTLVAFSKGLNSVSSNLTYMLLSNAESTRFMKVSHRTDGSWFAVLGAWCQEGTPIVVFGAGSDLIQALANLGRSIAKGQWKDDKYCKVDAPWAGRPIPMP